MLKPIIMTAAIALLGLLGLTAPAVASPYRVYSTGSPGFSRGVVIPQRDNYGYGSFRRDRQNRQGLTIINGENICINCRPHRQHQQRGYRSYDQRGRSNYGYGRQYNGRYY